MTTVAADPMKWAAYRIEDGFASAVVSGIVPDPRHLRDGGPHCSIEDLRRFGNAGDYSNSRRGDKVPPVTTPGTRYAAAFDVSMSRSDMRRVHANAMAVFRDKSDPRRAFVNAINCWDGRSEAVRIDYQAGTISWATPDHKWHAHTDQPRMFVDVHRNKAEAWRAARAVVSIITGQSKAAWIAAEGKGPNMSETEVITALRRTVPYASAGVGKRRHREGWGDVSSRAIAEYTWSDLSNAMAILQRLELGHAAVLAAVNGVDDEGIKAAIAATAAESAKRDVQILAAIQDTRQVLADWASTGEAPAIRDRLHTIWAGVQGFDDHPADAAA